MPPSELPWPQKLWGGRQASAGSRKSAKRAGSPDPSAAGNRPSAEDTVRHQQRWKEKSPALSLPLSGASLAGVKVEM